MSKTILVTGTSSGFGRDTAETLARAGHTVYASMRDVAGRNRPHADALRTLGLNVVQLDVTDDASVESAVAAVLARAGRIDVLVNNAGIAAAGVSEAFTPDLCVPCSRSMSSGFSARSAPRCRRSAARATASSSTSARSSAA